MNWGERKKRKKKKGGGGVLANVNKSSMLYYLSKVWFRFNMSGVEPNLLTYTAMIKCCCRSREVERALNLLNEMR
jgi:pentatricopeptide repeat protein